MIGLTACGNKEPEYSLEFIEGKTVTIEDNEYVGAFFNFTNNGDATTYCPNDNEIEKVWLSNRIDGTVDCEKDSLNLRSCEVFVLELENHK